MNIRGLVLRSMKILNIIQVIIAIFLIGGVLLQQRGGGLSPVFGGSGGAYRTRRGVERGIFIATIVLSILFLAVALLNVVLH